MPYAGKNFDAIFEDVGIFLIPFYFGSSKRCLRVIFGSLQKNDLKHVSHNPNPKNKPDRI